MRRGFRAGAGRPKGSKSVRLPTSATAEPPASELLPLDFLLSVMNDAT
jgi:hypothetical protein